MNPTTPNSTVAGSGAANNPAANPAPAAAKKQKGRKVGAVSFAVVNVADLVRILGASANIPVSRKFLDARGIAGTAAYAGAAYAAVAPAPIAAPAAPVAAPATTAPVTAAPSPVAPSASDATSTPAPSAVVVQTENFDAPAQNTNVPNA